MSKIKAFKQLITEFQEHNLPDYIHRDFEVELEPKLKKAIVLSGPRRSGKTYLFYQFIEQLGKDIDKELLLYINFEDDRLLPLLSSDLQFLLEAYYELFPEHHGKKLYFFLDEIQNIEGWESFVRRILDKENIQLFITGSSSKLLSHEIATSLRGRGIHYKLFPLDFKEYLSFKDIKLQKNFEFSKQRFEVKKLLNQFIEQSRFPELSLVDNKELERNILQEYYDTLVYRDIVDRYSLRNIRLLKNLLKHLFTNISKTMSVNQYYKSAKQQMSLSKDTVYEYLDYIEESGYFHFLPNFSYSLKEQRINPKKILCVDNGLRNAISFRFSSDTGKLVENLVGEYLLEKYSKTQAELFYWEDKKAEVDFIVKDGKDLHALNVSYGDEILERELESLLKFKQEFGSKLSSLTLISKDIEEEHKGIKITPLWEWLT